MAGRQFKEGLDYFPFDTSFFTNDKIQLIEAEFGSKGTMVALHLLCKIYSEKGYFYRWGGDECLLFCRNAGAEFVPSAVNEIVNGLVRRRFFDKGCFDRFGILTSQSIQEVYIEVCERRKKIELIKEYILCEIDKRAINVNIISINVDINAKKGHTNSQSKGKKSKGNLERDNAHEEMAVMFSSSEEEKSYAKKEYNFEYVWSLYDKKVGDKERLKKKWDNLSATDKHSIIDYIPRYIEAQPDKSYRKNFETFLNNRSWNDEIIVKNGSKDNSKPITSHKQSRDDEFAAHIEAKLRSTSSQQIR